MCKWQSIIVVKGAASSSSLSWLCERVVRATVMNLIGFSLCLLSGISSFLTNSYCEEITLSWRLIKVLCKVSTLLVRDTGLKLFSVICRNSVKGNSDADIFTKSPYASLSAGPCVGHCG